LQKPQKSPIGRKENDPIDQRASKSKLYGRLGNQRYGVRRERRIKGVKKTHNIALVELALEVGNDVVTRGHVGRDENVVPVIRPSRVVVVVV